MMLVEDSNSIHNTIHSNPSLWDLFTMREEYEGGFKDQHGRIPFYNSCNANILRPVVSAFLIEEGLDVIFPENHEFALCLTHDIDNYYLPWRSRFSHFMTFASQLKITRAFSTLFRRCRSWPIKDIIDIEHKYDAKSTFFFLAVDEQNDYMPLYRIPELKEELHTITDEGFEVGLHGGYYVYNDSNAIKRQKKRLERVAGVEVKGYRNHYLRFDVPHTWEAVANAGFEYDSTLGYPRMPGFRNGMCHPFVPYNMNTGHCIDLLEIPLAVMDGTLFDYLGLDTHTAWDICKYLIDRVKEVNGVLTVLWHNSSFDELLHPGWQKLYERILQYGYEHNAWMTSAEEIMKWWNRTTV